MNETWALIPGFEGRYAVSDAGRVRALSVLKRYLLRNGKPALRRVPERFISQQSINSGYLIVHLHQGGVRKALLVHRLVAGAFCPGFNEGFEVNHRNGAKRDNAASNLEWVARRDNLLHAVDLGLNPTAQPVIDPATGKRYPSIAQAARAVRRRARTVAAQFNKGAPCSRP